MDQSQSNNLSMAMGPKAEVNQWPPSQPAQAVHVPYSYLGVSEIERLAKAGVKVDIGPIIPQADNLYPSPNGQMKFDAETAVHELDQYATVSNTLSKAIWYRWLRARRALRDPDMGDPIQGYMLPFALMAHQYGDTVYVSVHPTDTNRKPFQLQDNAVIFPSDALMASIALWEKESASG